MASAEELVSGTVLEVLDEDHIGPQLRPGDDWRERRLLVLWRGNIAYGHEFSAENIIYALDTLTGRIWHYHAQELARSRYQVHAYCEVRHGVGR